ncbi:thioredoxin-like domain-containing protein [Polyangium aurulentum]|uniref:thioredoxin-like domain-containing protein n=1 Tax=Polyangium aurulentum TaxID=2567896 RepID=UPI0010AE8DED|nr:thioredoxin-like domain-containing protein [Polyangium aurulentum]UQA61476.1 redoxin domain-containing protein [Polyangium aurulentum]
MSLTIHAPDLDGALAWLNTDRPLSMRELRGNVVILDFWTYCCINCMHVLPILRAIEERHASDPLVVIGVHSGKFDAERDPARIREAIDRYDIAHPVAVDDDMTLWSRFGVRSWPTLVVVRPDGTIAAVAPGEPDLDVLEAFVQRELDLARKKGSLAAHPPRIARTAAADAGPLRYPGKITRLPDGRLLISDSGHHRLLLCNANGDVHAAIGSGKRGLRDGAFHEAAFDDPQGAAFYNGALYVADARNHAIRRVDLDRRTVLTVAGTGELGRSLPEGRALARTTALRSPWDLVAHEDSLFVAMAGTHQIWRFFPDSGEIEVFAGSGVEALVDGERTQSAWAQPSGLALRGQTLYVADSETSAVRALDLQSGAVRTLVGQGLFDFGHKDGPAREARLQHALGVAATADGILVADTYNGAIRHVTDPGGSLEGEVRTLLTGLHEPGAIVATCDGTWLIADTNAHRVVRVVAGHVDPIELQGAPTPDTGSLDPSAPRARRDVSAEGWFTAILELPPGLGLGPGDGLVALRLHAQPGLELSGGSPVRIALEVSRRSDLLLLPSTVHVLQASGGATQEVLIPVTVKQPPTPTVEAEIVAALRYVACDVRDHTACYPGHMDIRIPVRLLAQGGTGRIEFRVPLPELSV